SDLVQRTIVPDDAGRLKCMRIALEACEATCLAPPQSGEARPRHVAVSFERMTGGADAERLRNAGCVALLGGGRRLERNDRQSEETKFAHGHSLCCHERRYLMSAAAARTR